MWRNLNKVMANNGVPNPNFKGFMANNTKANWNVVQIVYGSDDASESMVNR
jgi:predicted phage tail protein